MGYILKPEVAGGWGDNTVADTSCHPPKISKLTYQFDGWSDDDLPTTFPCFIVSERLADLIESSALNGYSLAPVTVTKSELFMELYPGRQLPKFKWLKVQGTVGNNDFALNPTHRLVVSDAAFNIIKRTSITQCEVTPC